MNPKQIGNTYEREVAKAFSKWIYNGDDSTLAIWRNVNSGTLGTVRLKQGKASQGLQGDFAPLTPEGEALLTTFHIDSKSYDKVNIMFINESNQKSNAILKQWIKTCDEAKTAKKIACMVVKARNSNIPDFMLIPLTQTSHKEFREKVGMLDFSFKGDFSAYNCSLVLLVDFFKNINFIDFIKTFQNREGTCG